MRFFLGGGSCAFCVHILYFQKIFFDIIEIILERHTPARALRAISHRPKKKYPEKKLILGKFWQTFFSKFHILCLLYANDAIVFCDTYTTLKILKMKFYEICSNSKDFIFKFRGKKFGLGFTADLQHFFEKNFGKFLEIFFRDPNFWHGFYTWFLKKI